MIDSTIHDIEVIMLYKFKQYIVLEQQRTLLNSVKLSNLIMLAKSTVYMLVSLLVMLMALVTIAGSGGYAWLYIMSLLTLTALVFWQFALLFKVSDKSAAGDTDWDIIFEKYLHSEECFNQILANVLAVSRKLLETNAQRSKILSRIALVSTIQFACTMFAILRFLVF